MSQAPTTTHEWVSFNDPDEDRTWLYDVTFLESNWTCIFGRGCQGVLTGPAENLVQGCCSYGAHFADAKDQKRVERVARRLSEDQWQYFAKGQKGTTRTKKNGEIVTKLVDGACIFLNRPDFARGPGCALHVLALDNNESYIPLKPEVCWQLPLRRDDLVQDDGHVVTRITEWQRRDWGKGGHEFHWWCTESSDAFVGRTRVIDSMSEELIAMIGQERYDELLAYLDQRSRQPSSTRVAHPAIRRR